MAKFKDILKMPLSFPKAIEAQLPKGAPSISGILGAVADALPEGPDIPIPAEIPKGKFTLPKVTTFLKSVEEVLPERAPKVSEVVERVETPLVKIVEKPEGETAPTAKGIIPLLYE